MNWQNRHLSDISDIYWTFIGQIGELEINWRS